MALTPQYGEPVYTLQGTDLHVAVPVTIQDGLGATVRETTVEHQINAGHPDLRTLMTAALANKVLEQVADEQALQDAKAVVSSDLLATLAATVTAAGGG